MTTSRRTAATLELTIDQRPAVVRAAGLAQAASEVGAELGHGRRDAEVKTGKLLAVADYPTVDPNNVDAAPAADARGSRAFSRPFEPGSTFKSLTAAALIDAGVANPGDPGGRAVSLYEHGRRERRRQRVPRRPPNLTLAGVIEESSNIGISHARRDAHAQTPLRLHDEVRPRRTTTEVGLPGESGGIMLPSGRLGRPDELRDQFGQGVSTDGRPDARASTRPSATAECACPSQLVEGCRHADGTVTDAARRPRTQVVSASAATDRGHAGDRRHRGLVADDLNIPGYRVATKTGTAQQPDGNGGYGTSYLVSMAGLAPAEAPQYVVSVTIRPTRLMNSGCSAGPFQKVMTQVLKTNRVQPSTVPAPDLPPTY